MEALLNHHASPDVKYADLRIVRIKTLTIEMKNEEITRFVNGFDAGVGVRVLSNGAIGFVSGTGTTKKVAKECLENAYKISKNLKEKTVKLENGNTEKGEAIWKGKKTSPGLIN